MGCPGSKRMSLVVPFDGTPRAPSLPNLLSSSPVSQKSREALGASPIKVIDVDSFATPQDLKEGLHDDSDGTLNAASRVPTKRMSKAMTLAHKKFQELDMSGSGALERDQLILLSSWTFERFHPEGEALSTSELERITEELVQECRIGDALTFEDFADFITCACEEISRIRRVVSWQRQNSVRFEEPEVINIKPFSGNLEEVANPEALSLSRSAQAALDRHNAKTFLWCCHY
jgi:hypothetical protein